MSEPTCPEFVIVFIVSIVCLVCLAIVIFTRSLVNSRQEIFKRLLDGTRFSTGYIFYDLTDIWRGVWSRERIESMMIWVFWRIWCLFWEPRVIRLRTKNESSPDTRRLVDKTGCPSDVRILNSIVPSSSPALRSIIYKQIIIIISVFRNLEKIRMIPHHITKTNNIARRSQ